MERYKKTALPLSLQVILCLLIVIGVKAHASPTALSYQGRIVGTNGQPLEYGAVAFEFTITNPSGSCILYREQLNNIDMRNSKGVFDTPIGTGNKSYPADPSITLLDIFNNSASHTCLGGSTYVPIVTDGRLLRVQFHDGNGWRLISPDNIIRSVPYAAYAFSALKLGGKVADEFVLKTTLPSGTCSAGQVITFNGTTFTCVADQGGSGTITSVSGSGPIAAVTTSGSVTVSATVGSTAGTLAAGDDSRFTNARAPTGTASGDLTGSYPGPTIAASAVTTDKLADSSVTSAKIVNGTISVADFSAGSADGQVYRYNNSAWQVTKLNYTDLVNGNGASPWPTGSCTAGQFITWVSVLDGFTCSNISSSAITTAIGYTPANQARTITAGTGLTGGGDLSADRSFAVDVGTGANQIPQLDGSGKLPSAVLPGSQWTEGSGNIYRSTGNVGIGTTSPSSRLDILGGSVTWGNSVRSNTLSIDQGGSIELGGQNTVANPVSGGTPFIDFHYGTGAVEDHNTRIINDADGRLTFAADTASFNGNVGVGTTTPTMKLDVAGNVNGTQLCIAGDCKSAWPTAGGGGTVTSVAGGTGLTGGTITSTGTLAVDVGTTAGKIVQMDSSGYLPAVDGRNLTNLSLANINGIIPVDKGGTGQSSYTDGQILVGNSTGNTLAKQVLSGDAAMTNAGVVTVNGVKGVSVSAAPTSAGQVLRYGGSAWTPGFISMFDLRSTVTGSATFGSGSTGCTAGQTLTWTAATDNLACTNISIAAATQITGTLPIANGGTGTATTSQGFVFAGPASGGSGAPAFRALASTDLPSSITNSLWTESSGNIYRSSGNIGIGITGPTEALAVERASGETGLSLRANGAGTTDRAALNFHTLSSGTSALFTAGTKGWHWTARGNAYTTASAQNDLLLYKADGASATNIMTFDFTSGNVGVGTTTPSNLLHVNGTVDGEVGIRNSNLSSDSGAYSIYRQYSDTGSLVMFTNSSTRTSDGGAGNTTVRTDAGKLHLSAGGGQQMTIDTSGNVGVGTTSPTAKLEIGGVAGTDGIRFPDGTLQTSAAITSGTNNTIVAGWPDAIACVNGTITEYVFPVSSDSGGLVLYRAIANNTGDTYIQYNASAKTFSTHSGMADFDCVTNTWSIDQLYSNGRAFNFAKGPAAQWLQSGSNAYYNAGNVGIGTISPTAQIHLGGAYTSLQMGSSSTASDNFHWVNEMNGARRLNLYNGNIGSGASLLSIATNGNVGIGTTSPGYKLDVQGGDINASGSVRAAGVALTSDIRYKRDIEPLDNALEKILNIRGVSYNWRTEEFPQKHFNDRHQVGVIAQEVEQQFPEVVDTNKDGYKSVNYPALVAPLIEAVKTLYNRLIGVEATQTSQARRISSVEASKADKAETEALRAENAQLKADAEKQKRENAEMKARLDKIEKMLKSK